MAKPIPDHWQHRNHFLQVLTRFSSSCCLLPNSSRAAEPERSVIQIMTFSQQPVWDAPWRFDSVRRSGGSGFVIRANGS